MDATDRFHQTQLSDCRPVELSDCRPAERWPRARFGISEVVELTP